MLKVDQYFKENPYFSNTVLKKEFKYAPAGDADKSKVNEDGISDAQADFSWERDVKPQVCHPLASSSIKDVNQSSQATKIDWKDPENAFTKKYPRQVSEDEDADDLSGDPGSFFNFFEVESDPLDVSNRLALECSTAMLMIAR